MRSKADTVSEIFKFLNCVMVITSLIVFLAFVGH